VQISISFSLPETFQVFKTWKVCHSIKIKFGSFFLPDTQEIVKSTPFEGLPLFVEVVEVLRLVTPA
jgi:hypothetical protein